MVNDDLKSMIEHECFVSNNLLTTNNFIKYCKERSIAVSKEQLEQFEKLGIFYPFIRIKRPLLKMKIEYFDNKQYYKKLGILQDGETWDGDIIEEYAGFIFERDAKQWLKEGCLWASSSNDFQSEDPKSIVVENYYSVFQIYTLFKIIKMMKCEIAFDIWDSASINKLIMNISDFAKSSIQCLQKNASELNKAAEVCQILSTRYYPLTQTDKRTFSITSSVLNDKWNWFEYRDKWDAQSISKEFDLNDTGIKNIQKKISIDAEIIDPLRAWYELVGYISVEQKKKLKDKALLAQSLYAMEYMMRMFYKDLTGNKLPAPDEDYNWKDNFYGEGVVDNTLEHLTYITNLFHLNPKPKMILVVEGNSEEIQIPRLAKEFFGVSFTKIGVDVVNIKGIGNFEGSKKKDKYGALEKLIDYHHYKQTIVFIILDREGSVETIKNNLIKKRSAFASHRTTTKKDYIQLWKKTIELDNFNFDEIAKAMTEVSDNTYAFKADDFAGCENNKQLESIYKCKVGDDLPKTVLLEKLFGYILEKREEERTADKRRPIIDMLENIINITCCNHQPTRHDDSTENQKSGYLGDPI